MEQVSEQKVEELEESIRECLRCFKDIINRNLMALEEAANEEARKMLLETREKGILAM